MNDLLKQADLITEAINTTQRLYDLMKQIVGMTHQMVGNTHEMQAITNELRDHISDFEDFFRPLRSLLLLGKTLLRYSRLLGAEKHIRFARWC